LNKVQRVCHENPVGCRKAKTGTSQIPDNLTNLHSIAMVWDLRERSFVEVDGINDAATCERVGERRGERAPAATKITPGLWSCPFNERCPNERRGLTALHLFTVLRPVG
jgi:hypothetical protein